MTDTLDLQEAAALLKVDPETARRLAASGEIYGAQIGRSWVFLREDLIEYLRQQTRAQTATRRAGVDAVIPASAGSFKRLDGACRQGGDEKKAGRRFRSPPALP